MRVVIDTNIIVSAYLGGTLESILKAFVKGKFTLIVSKPIADEYFDVLIRPKFKIKRDEFDDFAALMMSKAEFVQPTETISAIEPDPSDNKFLEAAQEGKADYIVSGDSHLLDLQSFHGIPILSAREFLDRI
jgi:putative PIN family toxin of toxin-antitoxin system